MRQLRLLWQGADRYVVDGPDSGRHYAFFHDQTTEVTEHDADELLKLTALIPRCCGAGNGGETPILEDVDAVVEAPVVDTTPRPFFSESLATRDQIVR